ncbi:MAG: UDP-2,3-diacylglucosamine diphosphatase [Verrucomicrobiota bacterium]
MRYHAVWISDLHLGSRHSQAARLVDFLREHPCRELYLVGDIIDGWELRRRWWWTTEANTVIQKVLRLNRKQTRVTYVYGNHDEFLGQFAGLDLGGLHLVERTIHVSLDGRRFLVLHGHQLDGLVHFNRLLERVGARLYGSVLDFNRHFNRARRRLGFGYWSVAASLKLRAKSAVNYLNRFEEAMVRIAREAGVDGVICGHIHRPEIREVAGLHYLNCGDWVENCSALAEDFEPFGDPTVRRWSSIPSREAPARDRVGQTPNRRSVPGRGCGMASGGACESRWTNSLDGSVSTASGGSAMPPRGFERETATERAGLVPALPGDRGTNLRGRRHRLEAEEHLRAGELDRHVPHFGHLAPDREVVGGLELEG